jgi:hypothetical protein
VKFNIIQSSARADRLEDQETLTIQEVLELGRWVEQELSPKAGHSHLVSPSPAFRPLSLMFAENGNGDGVCGIHSIIGVLADGSYALCGIGGNVPELVFGHAARDRLADVWHDHPVLRRSGRACPSGSPASAASVWCAAAVWVLPGPELLSCPRPVGPLLVL